MKAASSKTFIIKEDPLAEFPIVFGSPSPSQIWKPPRNINDIPQSLVVSRTVIINLRIFHRDAEGFGKERLRMCVGSAHLNNCLLESSGVIEISSVTRLYLIRLAVSNYLISDFISVHEQSKQEEEEREINTPRPLASNCCSPESLAQLPPQENNPFQPTKSNPSVRVFWVPFIIN
ncbi:hypothetical protein CDAR_123351 [Caerostris darwini]|uniref:Uncharacterized protein n=1 Tax=Caerostris darwini TaxID=1538125 RepID=A0AAV4RX47_9ARAC|nr:hypothetical protein CDAR_123351 [Caerostris darwini]